MENEKNLFKESGLHIDEERVLTYSKLSCPLDCRYCFVDDLNQKQQQHVSYLSEEQFDLIGKLPKEVKLIMLGCDTEFFQSKENSLATLNRLAHEGKDISVITKFALSADFILEISKIREEMASRGNLLAFSISLPCFESASMWESRVPSPEKRIESLKHAFESGLKTLIAIRPLLPTVSNAELEHITSSTNELCYGYYSGPLYLKNIDESLIPNNMMETLHIEKLQPHWMPEGNEFFKIERPGQMEYLDKLVTESGKQLFEGAADAIQFLKEHEEF